MKAEERIRLKTNDDNEFLEITYAGDMWTVETAHGGRFFGVADYDLDTEFRRYQSTLEDGFELEGEIGVAAVTEYFVKRLSSYPAPFAAIGCFGGMVSAARLAVQHENEQEVMAMFTALAALFLKNYIVASEMADNEAA